MPRLSRWLPLALGVGLIGAHASAAQPKTATSIASMAGGRAVMAPSAPRVASQYAPVTPASVPGGARPSAGARGLVELTKPPPPPAFSRLGLIQKTAADNASNLDVYAATRYGAPGAKALAELRAIGKGYESLVADPGIVLRLGAFKRFVQRHGLAGADPNAARSAFAQSLGTRTVYRALALTDAEYANVLERGLQSGYEQAIDPSQSAPMLEPGAPTAPLADQVRARVRGFGRFGSLVSVGSSQRVAVAATSIFATDGRHVYLFKLRVPAIDLIHRGKNSAILPYTADELKKTLVLELHGKTTTMPFASSKVESFVLYDVAPSEIVSSRRVPDAQISTYDDEKLK